MARNKLRYHISPVAYAVFFLRSSARQTLLKEQPLFATTIVLFSALVLLDRALATAGIEILPFEFTLLISALLPVAVFHTSARLRAIIENRQCDIEEAAHLGGYKDAVLAGFAIFIGACLFTAASIIAITSMLAQIL